MGLLGSILKLAAPVAGFALGGPLGGMIGGAASSALGGAESGAKASKLNKQQLAIAKERYDAGAPFRSKLAQQAFSLPTQREDLSSIFADVGNPYARPISRLAQPILQSAPTPPPPAAPTAKGGFSRLAGALGGAAVGAGKPLGGALGIGGLLGGGPHLPGGIKGQGGLGGLMAKMKGKPQQIPGAAV